MSLIRHASKTDLEEIDNIYNQAIAKGFLTAHITPLTQDERLTWFNKFSSDDYPLYVYEIENKIVGWVSISPYRSGRHALDRTAEISFYVDFDFHGRNIGTELVSYCLNNVARIKKSVFIAIIIEGNTKSISLLEKLGFEQWGFLPNVINFQNEIRGQVYMGKVVSN